jgi:ribosome-associated translation inhibitor RaiA
MKALAEQKLAPLLAHIEKKSRDEAILRVVMNKSDDHDKLLVKIEASIEGKMYFGDEVDFVLETALIRAIDEVDKQYLRDKAKIKERDYGKNRDLKRFDGGDTDTVDSDTSLGA